MDVYASLSAIHNMIMPIKGNNAMPKHLFDMKVHDRFTACHIMIQEKQTSAKQHAGYRVLFIR